jgi:hypothetical protein
VKIYSPILLIIGLLLAAFAIFLLVVSFNFAGFIPLIVAGTLIYLGLRGGRIALLVFGHTVIVLGCFLVTWGIYLLPNSQPTLAHIFGRPLFWGLFSIFGGICAIYHGFCRCIRAKNQP